MKIAVVGSRNWNDIPFLRKKLYEYFRYSKGPEFVFISGGARGVDKDSEMIINEINDCSARFVKIEKKIFKPDWDKYGKSAGFIRNKLIINEADNVLAFWDGKSKGTKHSIDLAIKAGKPVDIYIR